MLRIFLSIFLSLVFISALPAVTSASEEIQGQHPLPIISEAFQSVPGSWATYTVRDIKKNATSHIYFSVDKQVQKNDKPAVWMEVEVETPGEPKVATRILAEETKDGPGELYEVIVQVEGYHPFKVPRKYFKNEDSKVGDFQPLKIQAKAEKESITWKDKPLSVWKVEAEDSKNQKSKAVVSEEVPPLAVVSIETPDTEMLLDSWGMDAKSKIKGKPMNFYLWLLLEAGKGLSGQ